MKPITYYVIKKYRVIYSLIYLERRDLFSKLVYDEDTDNYLQVYQDAQLFRFVYNMHFNQDQLMKAWHNYNSYLSKLKKKFERKRTILKRKAYMTIVRPYFCKFSIV